MTKRVKEARLTQEERIVVISTANVRKLSNQEQTPEHCRVTNMGGTFENEVYITSLKIPGLVLSAFFLFGAHPLCASS